MDAKKIIFKNMYEEVVKVPPVIKITLWLQKQNTIFNYICKKLAKKFSSVTPYENCNTYVIKYHFLDHVQKSCKSAPI